MPSMIFSHGCLYDFAITEGYATYYIRRLLETPGEHLLISLFLSEESGNHMQSVKCYFVNLSVKLDQSILSLFEKN